MLAAWALLWGWHALHAQVPCWLLPAFLLPVAVLILLAMLENALLQRRAWLGMYLRGSSGAFRLLRGGVFMLGWQALKATLFALILLLAVLRWPAGYWLLLLADLLLLWLLAGVLAARLAPHLRPGFAPRLARRLLAPLNTLLCGVALVALAYYSPHPDFRGGSLVQALHVGLSGADLHCAELALLARLDGALEAGGWWLAQAWLTRPELTWLAPLAWLLFLGASMAFVWGYSRLLLGTQVRPRELFGWLEGEPLSPGGRA